MSTRVSTKSARSKPQQARKITRIASPGLIRRFLRRRIARRIDLRCFEITLVAILLFFLLPEPNDAR